MTYDGVITKPSLDDALKHYGVKGMKWKKHKNKDLKDRGYESAEGRKKLYLDLDKKMLYDVYRNEETGNLRRARRRAKNLKKSKERAYTRFLQIMEKRKNGKVKK